MSVLKSVLARLDLTAGEMKGPPKKRGGTPMQKKIREMRKEYDAKKYEEYKKDQDANRGRSSSDAGRKRK